MVNISDRKLSVSVSVSAEISVSVCISVSVSVSFNLSVLAEISVQNWTENWNLLTCYNPLLTGKTYFFFLFGTNEIFLIKSELGLSLNIKAHKFVLCVLCFNNYKKVSCFSNKKFYWERNFGFGFGFGMLRLSVSVSVQTKPKFRYFGFGLNSGFGRSLVNITKYLITVFGLWLIFSFS